MQQKNKRLRSSADPKNVHHLHPGTPPSPPPDAARSLVGRKKPSTFAATIATAATFPPLSAMRPESGPPLPSPTPSAALSPSSPLRAELPARRRPPRSSLRFVSCAVPAVVPVVSPEAPEAPPCTRTRRRVAVDGRDARVRVPVPSAARMFQLTRELGLRSHVETLAWLLKNGEPFVCDALASRPGCIRVVRRLWKREKKRKKPILLSNIVQGSALVEDIQKKKRLRRRKQTLHVAYPLKVSEALGSKLAKKNTSKGSAHKENNRTTSIKSQGGLKIMPQKEASGSTENKIGKGKGNGHLEDNTETTDYLLNFLRKEKEMRESISDKKYEERDEQLFFDEKPFQIQSVCELLSTQLLQRSESLATAQKNNASNSPILPKSAKKKLLILDLNGLLADIVINPPPGQKADKKVNGKSVFKRPFCDDFLRFCFEKYEMAVWSSRKRDSVNMVVNTLMGELKDRLLFCWDQSKCTKTGFYTVENKHKPLFLKELKKIWDKEDPDLPWERGFYLPSNTLLLDDSPYKALRNPPFTAIFPQPYNFTDKHDNALGPGGELRLYLEELAEVDDVQQYIQDHPYGQHHINESNPSWPFYLQILKNFAMTR